MSIAITAASEKRGRRRKHRRALPIAAINRTPFIDVVLVLLIIFMVAAPMLTVGVPIELPKSAAKPMQDETQPIVLSVNPKGEIYLQETQISLDDVVAKLQAISKNGVDDRIFIRGDKSVDYGTMMRVMGLVSGAGFKKIGLVTVPDEERAAPPH